MVSETKEKRKHIDELHEEHRLWSSTTKLYADELSICQQRLDELAAKNNTPGTRMNIAHFQNQFIIQKEELDKLRHNIHAHEQSLAQYAQKHPVAIDHVLFADHSILRDQCTSYNKLFEELKAEFRAFLDKQL